MKRFIFIGLHSAYWPIREQCQLLGVSPSSYYTWRKRASVSAAEPVPVSWQVASQYVFTNHAGCYIQSRLQAQLRREGHAMGRQCPRSWFSASGLRALCSHATTHYPGHPEGRGFCQ